MTGRHCNLETELAQWAYAVKSVAPKENLWLLIEIMVFEPQFQLPSVHKKDFISRKTFSQKYVYALLLLYANFATCFGSCVI